MPRLPEAYTSFLLVHQPSGRVAARVRRADGWWAKGRGVIGWRALLPGEGLWLPGVCSIHTFFVPFPLDLLFLDDRYIARRLVYNIRPWRPLVWVPGARHTVELGAGTLALTAARAGERWELRPDESGPANSSPRLSQKDRRE